MAITQTETHPAAVADPANEMLAEKLNSISGVRVSTRIARCPALVFEVAVEEGDEEAEMAVYQAKLEVYQRFPEARLEVYVV